ncbi:hypothetical protein CLF_100684 [Clonorchis sinensis]|uniref:Uncharacterized protein n=1 Tax=Clonorchis sinensis TaxID=79923 RepID=G7Y407_CLOSI|nr:hypothetical protein CLF_100684 [Clonorchis sinensis]
MPNATSTISTTVRPVPIVPKLSTFFSGLLSSSQNISSDECNITRQMPEYFPGRECGSFAEFESKLREFQRGKGTCYARRHSLPAAKYEQNVGEVFAPSVSYAFMVYRCVHARSHWNANEKGRRYVDNCLHNHPVNLCLGARTSTTGPSCVRFIVTVALQSSVGQSQRLAVWTGLPVSQGNRGPVPDGIKTVTELQMFIPRLLHLRSGCTRHCEGDQYGTDHPGDEERPKTSGVPPWKSCRIAVIVLQFSIQHPPVAESGS